MQHSKAVQLVTSQGNLKWSNVVQEAVLAMEYLQLRYGRSRTSTAMGSGEDGGDAGEDG